MSEILKCALCLVCGCVSRICFSLITKSSAKISKLSLIALDVLWGILSVAAFASVVFFLSNGETHPFMVISMVVGFSMTAVFY